MLVRKILAYLLSVLMIWQIIGFVAYFEVSHFQLKKEIKLLLKQGVDQSELINFTFSHEELNSLVWVKKNEFVYKDGMYDVVRRKNLKNNKVHLECISDKKETILFARLGQTISQNLGSDKHPTPISIWGKFLSAPVIISDNVLTPVYSSDYLDKDQFSCYKFSIKTCTVDLIEEPPC